MDREYQRVSGESGKGQAAVDRKLKPEEPVDDVPKWILTFSDVITLLMTFFILLLTFASSEPERFEKMQVAVFGGGGASGIVGETDGKAENDSIVMRQRPRSSRLSTQGSQTPPIYSDPSIQSLAKGLEGLEESLDIDTSSSYSFEFPLSLLISRENAITNQGHQFLRMFARRVRKDPFSLSFVVASDEDVPSVLILAQHLIQHEDIAPFKIRIGASNAPNAPKFSAVLTRAKGT